jgi:hypothetical protein
MHPSHQLSFSMHLSTIGSEHTLWCLRVTGAVRFEKWEAAKGYVVPPPKDDFVFESF